MNNSRIDIAEANTSLQTGQNSLLHVDIFESEEHTPGMESVCSESTRTT